MATYRITTRAAAKVRRERADALDSALASLERHARELERSAGAHAIGGGLLRKFEPVQQVVGRIELAGPGRLGAGVDVRETAPPKPSRAACGAGSYHSEPASRPTTPCDAS